VDGGEATTAKIRHRCRIHPRRAEAGSRCRRRSSRSCGCASRAGSLGTTSSRSAGPRASLGASPRPCGSRGATRRRPATCRICTLGVRSRCPAGSRGATATLPAVCQGSVTAAGRVPLSATAEATRWSRRSVASTRTSRRFARSSTARRAGSTPARAASRPARSPRPPDSGGPSRRMRPSEAVHRADVLPAVAVRPHPSTIASPELTAMTACAGTTLPRG